MSTFDSVLRLLLCVGITACASYRVLPPPPLESGAQPIPVRYEKSRLLLFKSTGEDGAIARVFASDGVALATVARPAPGLLATADGGRSWTVASGPSDVIEVVFAPGRVYARTTAQIWHSEDQGRTWAATTVVPKDDRLDTMAVGPDGAVYTAGRSRLYVSDDGARTFRAQELPPQGAWRARSIVPDPLHPHVLYVSLRMEPQGELLARFRALLDFSSDEALSALKLVDAHDAQPRTVAWGNPADGVYVTMDSGGLWKKTGLSIDAWLAQRDGALYAVAAEPILAAAALVRGYPALAGIAERQMKSARSDSEGLRAALPYPGREALLAGPIRSALVFRSSDGGAAWARVDEPHLPLVLALRDAVERGGPDRATIPPPPQETRPQQRGRPPEKGSGPQHAERPLAQGRGGRSGARQQPQQSAQPQVATPRAVAPEILLAFVDPQRLLARFNGAAPISFVSGDAATVPTQQGWDALVAFLVTESEAENEISLGPAQAANVGFELLRSSDAGAKWAAGTPLPPGSPRSLAAADHAVYVVRHDGRAFRIAP